MKSVSSYFVNRLAGLLCLASALVLTAAAQRTDLERIVSGIVIAEHNEVVSGARIEVQFATGKKETLSDAAGRFHLIVPREPVTLMVDWPDWMKRT